MSAAFEQNVSVVLLNHNRFSLLRTTLLSLLQTAPNLTALHVVDNDSTDFSTEWLERMASLDSRITLHPCSPNRGGESLNPVLESLTTELVLIAENDHQYLPGWSSYFERIMTTFPEVGQLSPLGAIPERDFGEEWADKPFTPIERDGLTLHKADYTVTTTGLIRREILERGIRFHNLEDAELPLPADERFSREIQEAGWWAAWSHPYQVINWGHHRAAKPEFSSYYEKNWKRKITLEIDGLERLQPFTDESTPLDQRFQQLLQAHADLVQLHHGTDLQHLEDKIQQTEEHNRQLTAANQDLQQQLSSTTPAKKTSLWQRLTGK